MHTRDWDSQHCLSPTALPQSHSKSIGVAGCCSRELGFSREAELVSSHTSPFPLSTEGGPELRAKILESFIMASEVAELPTAPGKRRLVAAEEGQWVWHSEQ